MHIRSLLTRTTEVDILKGKGRCAVSTIFPAMYSNKNSSNNCVLLKRRVTPSSHLYMKKLLFIAAVLVVGAVASQAGVSVNFGFGYSYPQPVVVGHSAPYCAPPVYVAPPCPPRVYVPRSHYWPHYRHGYHSYWRGHGGWHDGSGHGYRRY